MGKIKLAIICYFSSQQIRDRLALHFGRHYSYLDRQLWNETIIKGLEGRDDVEVHVISPHQGMKHGRQDFDKNGVYYHYFRSELPYPWWIMENKIAPQKKRNYPRNRRYVKEILKSISPDIVNLVGAENPFYSIAALDVNNIPIIIHCQTVYANPARKKSDGVIDQQRWDVELKLFHKTPYIACNGKMYYDLIKGYEPNAIIFPRRWPESVFPNVPDAPKKYDFVYFARMLNRNKGFDNAIEAMGIAIIQHPEMKFLAIGTFDKEKPYFEQRIKELGLENRLDIQPSFTERVDMLHCVKQGRFALLPVTMDVISGTIMEAMRMGLPVVTCRTSGTPSLNEKWRTVLISDIGDSKALAQNMIDLYESPELQEELANNTALYIKNLDEDNAKNADIMVAQYKAVYNHYRQGDSIPHELLFDENKLVYN